ncbi:hypothetical protein [Rickettsia endosymbiont of Orchestes rusci]
MFILSIFSRFPPLARMTSKIRAMQQRLLAMTDFIDLYRLNRCLFITD